MQTRDVHFRVICWIIEKEVWLKVFNIIFLTYWCNYVVTFKILVETFFGFRQQFSNFLQFKKSNFSWFCAHNMHAQVKIRDAYAGQMEMRMRISKWDAHAQVKIRCACASQNTVPMHNSKWDAQMLVKMRCACADRNEMRMRRSKSYQRYGVVWEVWGKEWDLLHT